MLVFVPTFIVCTFIGVYRGWAGVCKAGKGQKMNFVARLEGWLAAILIFAGGALGLMGIILRYLFGLTWPWTEGIVVVLTVWGALLAGAVAVHDNSHLSLDLLVKQLPTRLRQIALVFRHLAVVIFTGSLFLLSMNYWLFLFQAGSRSFVTYLPNWVTFSGLPVALLFMVIHSLYHTVNSLRKG